MSLNRSRAPRTRGTWGAVVPIGACVLLIVPISCSERSAAPARSEQDLVNVCVGDQESSTCLTCGNPPGTSPSPDETFFSYATNPDIGATPDYGDGGDSGDTGPGTLDAAALDSGAVDAGSFDADSTDAERIEAGYMDAYLDDASQGDADLGEDLDATPGDAMTPPRIVTTHISAFGPVPVNADADVYDTYEKNPPAWLVTALKKCPTGRMTYCTKEDAGFDYICGDFALTMRKCLRANGANRSMVVNAHCQFHREVKPKGGKDAWHATVISCDEANPTTCCIIEPQWNLRWGAEPKEAIRKCWSPATFKTGPGGASVPTIPAEAQNGACLEGWLIEDATVHWFEPGWASGALCGSGSNATCRKMFTDQTKMDPDTCTLK